MQVVSQGIRFELRDGGPCLDAQGQQVRVLSVHCRSCGEQLAFGVERLMRPAFHQYYVNDFAHTGCPASN